MDAMKMLRSLAPTVPDTPASNRVITSLIQEPRLRRRIQKQFNEGHIHSEADLRWRLAEALERRIKREARIGDWQVNTEVPLSPIVEFEHRRGRVVDIVVHQDGRLRACIELKIFSGAPAAKKLAKDADTLSIARTQGTEVGVLYFLVRQSLHTDSPCYPLKKKWEQAVIVEEAVPVLDSAMDEYSLRWRWQ